MYTQLREELEESYRSLNRNWDKIKTLIGGKPEWARWLKDNSHSDDGYSYSVISGTLSWLKVVYEVRNESRVENYSEVEIEKYSQKATKLSRFLEKTILEFEESEFASEELVKSESQSIKYHYWHFNFLHVTPPGGADKRPKIARTLLKVSNSPKEAVLINLEDPQSEDYQGRYDEIGKSGVYAFDLWNKKRNRKLYFKIHFPNTKYRVVIGAYTTFDSEKIYSGRIVLRRIDSQNKDDLKSVLLGRDVTSGFDSIVDHSIQEFLSQRDKNYLMVPNSNGTLNGIKAKTKDSGPFQHIERRFFDFENPRLFLACPILTAQHSSREIDILQDLQTELKTGFPNLIVDLNERNRRHLQDQENEFRLINLESFEKLQGTRFFVIIIEETQKSSFSLVELGFALAKCKYVLILHKAGTVSKKIEELKMVESRHVRVQDFKNSIVEDFPSIKQWIISFIGDFS
ncbi:hypothetical protein BXY85_1688 [Roseivirga pacifica]|uniref:Uncharacterized protein n=1 Tax=Roseivirga pacifica TaxID=1267423 RepID=A0A1I0MUR9_9BACT|nr:hypothetical protein [Roseivirga pacifica]MCO6359206.1 hypothetical protein [Roseivirga pacifica]MCO6365158.1 hypothetical protein [Roseivirga pacifica]MCO6372112.1 hypothetical protein [Roseivirga pacifica]MCO6375777.1 hypothetical protein [Roseivirga pacifica]MCO6379490.1 hypothetical protein [Roseivirga pacifica]